jgi:hypothetical protein
MKAKLEFNLDNPDDQSAFGLCNQAVQMALALYDIDEYLRDIVNKDTGTEEEVDFAQKLRDYVREIVNDRQIKNVLY